ncbi:MAG: trypsin-like peptidase domain-containing protein [Patescibacteria group bacterium]
MSKLEYEDSSMKEYVADKKNKGAQLAFIVIIVILIFFAGAVGGIGGVVLLSQNNGELATKIGLSRFKDLAIPTTSTQKITVEESNAFIDVVNKVSNSVVSITQKSTVQTILGSYETQAAGTGFIITSDGLILTNKHVVSDTNGTYTVIMRDGKTYDAKVQSLDPVNDLAVIKVEARNLPVVELGDSDQLQVGQWVITVGNALGQFQNTVTSGIISAKGRKIDASSASGSSSETLSDLLQTDAAINSGNSGGPLVNLAGQVIGINTAVASGAQGIGFAIPINAAKSAIDSIKKTGRIIRPYLGVRYFEITPSVAKQSSLPSDHGALVQRGRGLTDFAVVPGSPADKAGIAENDIITEVNGQIINEDHSLVQLVQQYQVGETVTLKVVSKGETKEVKVKLEESR